MSGGVRRRNEEKVQLIVCCFKNDAGKPGFRVEMSYKG